jgi:signal peptidase I
MSETGVSRRGRRFAWLAAVLSILMPGVGQVYCGRLLRGLVFGLLYGVAIPVALGVIAYASPVSTILLGLLLAAAAFGVVLAAAVDSYRVARRTPVDYDLKSFNHVAVYLLLGLIVQGGCLGYTLYVRSTLFEAFRVPSASEYPTIHPNDRILVDKTAYRRSDPQRGDVVLFRPPDSYWRGYYIKRIVAVAGDTVEMTDGIVRVNGRELSRRKIPLDSRIGEGETFEEISAGRAYLTFRGATPGKAVRDFGEVRVPPYHCFVLGDNRDNSLDSRDFGSLPYAEIVGRADYIYWPAEGWSRFGRLQ